MDVVTIIIAIVAGAIGGWLISVVAKNMSMGTVWDLVIGLIAGVVVVWIAAALNWANWGVPYIGAIVIGLVAGLVVVAIVGAIRGSMK
jgi:uncharacterized membrane protein YeaQ/YmgE (transglycosylase-associated protein family)